MTLHVGDDRAVTAEPRGECIGEMSLIEDRQTSAFVIAEEDSSLMVVPEEIFWEQLIQLPNAVRNILRIL